MVILSDKHANYYRGRNSIKSHAMFEWRISHRHTMFDISRDPQVVDKVNEFELYRSKREKSLKSMV